MPINVIEAWYHLYLAAAFAPALVLAIFCFVLWSKARKDQPSKAKRLLPGFVLVLIGAVAQPALRVGYGIFARQARTTPELGKVASDFLGIEGHAMFVAQYILYAGVILCISAGFRKLPRQSED